MTGMASQKAEASSYQKWKGGFKVGNKNMKLKRFSEEEKIILREFIKRHEAEGKTVAYSELPALSLLLDKVNGNLGRVPTRLWDALKRFGGMVTQGKRASKVSDKTIKKIANSGAAVKKILDELAPIIKFMGKPPEYLRPLELLLIEHETLAKRLNTAEEKITINKAANKTAKTSIAAAKASARKTKEMTKELKTLRNFLNPAKIILRETCDLRMQAAALTKRAEALKKKNGTDLFKFLQDLEDSALLKAGQGEE